RGARSTPKRGSPRGVGSAPPNPDKALARSAPPNPDSDLARSGGVVRRVASRLLQLVPTTLGALVLVFLLMRVLPGDPAAAMLGNNATPQSVADLRELLGLDKPLAQQFIDYVSSLAHLDLGRSLAVRTPVTTLLGQALWP